MMVLKIGLGVLTCLFVVALFFVRLERREQNANDIATA
jgi:hypothetical protein